LAQIAKIIEGRSGEQAVKDRLARLEAVLKKAEHIIEVARTKTAKGEIQVAKNLKKAAKGKARMAMRLVGILIVEFDKDMDDAIKRIRRITKESTNGSHK
jgi:hypothetical protein